CDERQLAVEDRLRLYCDVCAAVQYAHRTLVVHLDLKPLNILVTGAGRVALLDFGVARLLDGHAGTAAATLTVTAERMLTPLYASPEQIRGEAVSTATDVYALGVLLHVLLTGGQPYHLSTKGSYDVARAVLEQEPERPSVRAVRAAPPTGDDAAVAPEAAAASRGSTPARLARRLRGDLDAIVLKAMEKDPARRYATAEQLETDVRRHLAGRPVLAQTGGRIYHARKFVRRHRLGVGLAAGMAALVLGFALVAIVQSARIRAQSARIALERDRAEQVSRFLMNMFRSADPAAAGNAVTARDILDHAAAGIDQPLFDDPAAHAGLLFHMGEAYHRLSFHDRAAALVESALAVRRELRPASDTAIAATLHLLGSISLARGELDAAEAAFVEALALRRRARGARHRDVARTQVGLAAVLQAQRRLPEAERAARAALAIDEGRTGDVLGDRAQSASALASIVLENGDHGSAALLYTRALALLREKYSDEHADVAAAVFGLAAALHAAGDRATADSLVRYGHGLYQRRLLVSAFQAGGVTAAVASGELVALPAPLVEAAPGSSSMPASLAGSAVSASRIVFVSDRDGPDPTGDAGNHEIYVMNADGSDQRRLTTHESLDHGQAWSPDGARIAFSSRRTGSVHIFTMNADGTDQRRITQGSEVGFQRPTWSPDGRRLAFQSLLRPDIYVSGVDGTGLTNITNHAARDFAPAWSPDGRRLAFTSDRDGNDEIYLMDPNGKRVVRLTHNHARDHRPEWSPDGTRIAFSSDRDGEMEIYVMNADGSDPLRLTFNPTEDGHPAWSPDGREIAFHRRVLGHGQIHVMNVDGSDVRRITELSTVAFNGFPRWAPAYRR
ncbi:MAG TPA: tetratricopeptide repeat protein, partial [Longimicrobiales bacterium]|nr:tetratricopeptide repeat protein [Longimicrobiales bacterium]